jgi:hypothetical protein
MQHDAAEQKRGMIWLTIVGPVAIVVTIALYCTNNFLENSPTEKILGDTLRELRGAQTSVKSNFTDERQTNESAHSEGLRVVTNASKEHD